MEDLIELSNIKVVGTTKQFNYENDRNTVLTINACNSLHHSLQQCSISDKAKYVHAFQAAKDSCFFQLESKKSWTHQVYQSNSTEVKHNQTLVVVPDFAIAEAVRKSKEYISDTLPKLKDIIRENTIQEQSQGIQIRQFPEAKRVSELWRFPHKHYSKYSTSKIANEINFLVLNFKISTYQSKIYFDLRYFLDEGIGMPLKATTTGVNLTEDEFMYFISEIPKVAQQLNVDLEKLSKSVATI